MNVDVGFWASFAAGIISFLSPCILPLVLPYLCFVAGALIFSGMMPVIGGWLLEAVPILGRIG